MVDSSGLSPPIFDVMTLVTLFLDEWQDLESASLTVLYSNVRLLR